MFIVALLAKSKSRVALSCYIAANLLSIALWAASLTMIENDIHRVLWYLGVLCEVLVNVIFRGDKTLSWAASHLAERLGLLSLIVLGNCSIIASYLSVFTFSFLIQVKTLWV